MKIWMGSARKLFFFFVSYSFFLFRLFGIEKFGHFVNFGNFFGISLVFDLFIYNNLNNRKKGEVKESSSSSRGRKI